MAPDSGTELPIWNLEQKISNFLGRKGHALPLPPRSSEDDDQLFPFVIATLASEAPIEDVPVIAALRISPLTSKNPFRVEFARMAYDSAGTPVRYVPGTAESKTLEVIRAKYMQFAGYAPDVTGVALAACDYYLGRVRDSSTAPIVAAGCISFLSASFRSRLAPEWLQIAHRECADVTESFIAVRMSSSDAAAQISRLAESWAVEYRVPRA